MTEGEKADKIMAQGKALARLAGSCVSDPEIDKILKAELLGKISSKKAETLVFKRIKERAGINNED